MWEFLPQFRFLLDDLARVDERALRARPVSSPVRVALLLLKIASGNARLADDLRRWADELRAVVDRPGGIRDFKALLSHIEYVGKVPADELHRLAAELGPRAEEAYVTTAEELEARGEARGRAGALVQLLRLKFGSVPAAALRAVQAASTDQLETWTGRVSGLRQLEKLAKPFFDGRHRRM